MDATCFWDHLPVVITVPKLVFCVDYAWEEGSKDIWLGFLRIFWNKVSSASAIRCSSSKSVAQYPWRLQRRMNAFNLCLSAAVIKGSTSSFDRCVEVTYGPFGFVLWWISFHVTTLSRPLVVDVPTVKMRPASNARLSNPQISSPSALPGR